MRELPLLALVTTLAFLAGCLGDSGPAPVDVAYNLSVEAVKNSSTYRFDGVDLRVLENHTDPDCETCFEFIFYYVSEHIGYGNRSKDNPRPKETPHRVEVIVKHGRVTRLVVDRKWDELTQEPMSFAQASALPFGMG